jgi:hypothetical protein
MQGSAELLEELFEIWTTGYLGVYDQPAVVLDPDGHWPGDLADTDDVHPAAPARRMVGCDLDQALDVCPPSDQC